MGCRGSKVVDENAKAEPVFKAYKKRKCRDVLWILIFAAYLVGMVAVFLVSYKYGDAARLLYALDFDGNQCGGVDSICYDGKQCGKHAVYPRVDRDIAQAIQSGKATTPESFLTLNFYALCVSSCPEGPIDLNEDGLIHDWVCEYETLDKLNTDYPALEDEKTSPEIPTAAAKVVLEDCLQEKLSYPGPFSEHMLSGECRTYMSKCFKSYVNEKSLFFRCVPQTQTSETCTESPYLVTHNKSVSTYESGNPRPASDEFCGTCIDPVTDANGDVMSPGDPSCKAKVKSARSNTIEVASNPIFDAANSWSAFLIQWMGDVMLTQEYILASGAGGALVVSILWLVLLRLFAGVFVWLAIWALLFCFAFLTCIFLIQGKVISVGFLPDVLGDATSAEQEETSRIAGFCLLGLSVIYLLLIMSLQRKIRLAVQVLKEATKIVAVMPTLMIFPLFTAAASISVGVYWVWVSMMISSAGEISASVIPGVEELSGRRSLDSNATSIPDVITQEFESASTNTYLWIYNFFGYLWINQILHGISAVTIAGAAASHYWASEIESEKKSKMPKRPVLASLKRTFRFHLGSIIFGSFIIAIVQLIRAGLAYLDKQTRTLQRKNSMVKILMKTVHCCLWCFEKILKFITKHGYIQIALKGSSFCKGCKDAFMLTLNNLSLIAVVSAINNLLLLFARLMIAAAAGSFAWLLVSNYAIEDDAPSTNLVPVVVSSLLAWFVGGLFMSVYGLTVDTILICFCEDQKENDGSPNKPYYMSNSLKRIAKKSNKMYKREAEARKAAEDDDDEDPMSPVNAAPKQQLL